jgi:hypothetical protein
MVPFTSLLSTLKNLQSRSQTYSVAKNHQRPQSVQHHDALQASQRAERLWNRAIQSVVVELQANSDWPPRHSERFVDHTNRPHATQSLRFYFGDRTDAPHTTYMTLFEQDTPNQELAQGSPTPQFEESFHPFPPVLENSSFNAVI